MKYRALKGWAITCLVALTPLLLWILFKPTYIGLGTTSQKLDVLGKLFGLVGLSLFSWNIILSGRIKRLEGMFFGLDRQYRAHHIIGGVSLLLLLAHAELITLKYASISMLAAYVFIKPSVNDLALLVGKFVLFAMATLLVVTFYVKLKYQKFVTIHRILGILIFLAGYHAIFVAGSDVRKIPILFVYMLFVGGCAGFVYVYRSIFHGTFSRVYDYELETIKHHDQIIDITLRPVSSKIRYYAGQFVFLSFQDDSIPNEPHPFSISSGSESDKLRFCIKKLGDFTTQVSQLKPGIKVKVEGPYGAFSFTKTPQKRQIWVAGGIGITPFLSMAASLPIGYKIDLYYCVKDVKDLIFLDELKKISDKNKGLKIMPWASSRQRRRLTASDIAKYSRDVQDSAILLCGPNNMMKKLELGLKDLDVSSENIYYEEFKLI